MKRTYAESTLGNTFCRLIYCLLSNSAVVLPYVRKSPRVSAALLWLYLKGVSSGDMSKALSVLLGDEAKGLSANVVSRLKG